MATTSEMIKAGITDVGCTFVLIYMAYLGDKVFNPILQWYYSFQYSKPPVIDPGITTWVYPTYYGMILCMWIALQFALFFLVMNRRSYGYGQP